MLMKLLYGFNKAEKFKQLLYCIVSSSNIHLKLIMSTRVLFYIISTYDFIYFLQCDYCSFVKYL